MTNAVSHLKQLVTQVTLGALYFLLIVPLGFFLKKSRLLRPLEGKDPLLKTYRKPSIPRAPDHLKRTF